MAHQRLAQFREYSARALAKAIRKALVLYQTPDLMTHMRRTGMLADFSWARTSKKYVEIFDRLLGS